jgi:hypothetical protein
MMNWWYVQVADGEGKMKEVEGANWSYCSCCSHGTTGGKMHVSDKHKTKEAIEAEGTSQGHATATGEEENDELQMMGCLMRSMLLCKEVLKDID